MDFGATDDLRYSFDLAQSLAMAADAAAAAVEGQAGSRAGFVSSGEADFRGRFAELFSQNAATAEVDAVELVSRLRDIRRFMDDLSDAAREENTRRRKAREWLHDEQVRRDWKVDGLASWLGWSTPPNRDAVTPPTFDAAPVSAAARVTPGVGSGGGGGGISSARPESLRSFASGTAGLDGELSGYPGQLDGAAADFMATCDFGGIDVGPVTRGFQAWLDANANDVSWANAIAAAFEAAGGSGEVVSMSDAALEASLAAAGVAAIRTDLVIDPPTAWGGVPTTGFVNDPVNSATGNFLEPELDLGFSSALSGLSVSRMYNSLDAAGGVFGRGWSSVFDVVLRVSGEGARFVQADGRHVVFGREGEAWGRASGESFWLRRVGAGEFAGLGLPESVRAAVGFVVSDRDGGWWAFRASGEWLAAGRGAGGVVWVERGRDGAVARILHGRGRFVEVEYAGGRVVSVSGSDGRRVEYLYEGGRLVGVSSAAGVRRYRWSAAGLIDRVVSAAGVVECTNLYDEQGRVREQTTQFGRRTRFSYLAGRVTEVADADGSNANSWIADRQGRLIGVIDAHGKRQSMSYDRHGNLVSVVDRDGRATVHAYDEHGRKVRTVTPEGADFTFGYDGLGRITTVVTGSGGVVAYEYADEVERNPSRITDPVGGVTELVWADGLLKQVTDPEGVTVRFEHDAHGELVAAVDADGGAARLHRDPVGRVVEAVTALGYRTRYRYDGAGLLVSREDPDGAVWRFEHGLGGRVVAVVDPVGARTEMEYGPHGELTRTIDPLGRVIEREFDAHGNVSGVVLPDGAGWAFAHDALSRLREVTDSAGGAWLREYDASGRLSATVDPTGVRVDRSISPETGVLSVRSAFGESKVRYDQYGRPEKVEAVDGSASLIAYDAAGRPVELVDAEGGLTKVERDLAGRVVSITSPAGRVTRYEYDRCGRPVAAIDALGNRTELVYDADWRVVARVLPGGERAELEYDACGRLIRERTPGAGAARFGYDRAGRLVFAQDARFGARRFGYDAAGQLVSATNGVGGVTRYGYDVRGRVTRIVDPAGGVTVRTYTQLDKVASQTDPLGRTTTAGYDAAGRQTSQTSPDGGVLEWGYDAAGRETTLSVDGRLVREVERDERAGVQRIIDRTGEGAELVHTLRYDRNGRLLEQSSGGRVTRWSYDQDGLRTVLDAPDGSRVVYERDAAGRLTGVEHTAFGTVRYQRDAAGRVVESVAASPDGSSSVAQTWTYANGFPVEHARIDPDGVTTTRMVRDEDGRIQRIETPEGSVDYGYDDACQLVRAASPAGTLVWEYDAAGRLVHETGTDGSVREFAYDVAGQLLAVDGPRGRSEFAYDGQGRRVRAASADGGTTAFRWDGRGWLTGITEQSADGTRVERVLRVDALGQLAEADGVRFDWDAAVGVPSLLSAGGSPVFRAPGSITGADGAWGGAAWRDARATDAEDPWQALAAASAHDGVGITPDGGVMIAGLEWMGARAYDPASRGFLVTDPVQAPAGAVWAGNPYSFAGNDPLHAIDPLGLQPVTDAELQAMAAQQHAGSLGGWWENNWEYVAAGAAIVGGIALMCTGVGGPAGLVLVGMASGALISGGVSLASAKADDGTVSAEDWQQVGVNAAIGAVAGGVGGATAGILGQGVQVARVGAVLDDGTASAQGIYGALAGRAGREAISSAASNATSNALDYGIKTPDATAGGYLGAIVSGATIGAAGSGLTSHFAPRLAGEIGDVLPVVVAGRGGAHSAGAVNMTEAVANVGLNHVAGGTMGAANALVQPGGYGDPVTGWWQGFAGGATGVAAGLSAA